MFGYFFHRKFIAITNLIYINNECLRDLKISTNQQENFFNASKVLMATIIQRYLFSRSAEAIRHTF